MTDRIIFKDGRISIITTKEAYQLQYKHGKKWRIDLYERTFEWHNNCWMET